MKSILLSLAIMSSMLSVSSQAQQPTTICPTTSIGQLNYSQGCLKIEPTDQGYPYSPSGQREKENIRIIDNDVYEVSPSGPINKKIGQIEYSKNY